MSEALQLVPDNAGLIHQLPEALGKRIEHIKAYHAGCIIGFKQHMGYAYLAGVELVALKEALPHGEFEKTRSSFLPEVTERTAQRYMKFAGSLLLNPPGGNATPVSDLKLLPNGELTEESRELVLKSVYEMADGKTLTEMYRDLGVIREKKIPVHTPPKELTPEEQLKAEVEQADAVLNLCAGQLEVIAEGSLMHAPKSTPLARKRFRNALRACGACYKKKKVVK